MDDIKNISRDYIKTLFKRAKESRIYSPHQSIGLTLSEILNDPENKAIYMRLAKIYDNQELIRKARDIGERKNIENKGAYFMKILKDIKKLEQPKFAYYKKKTRKPIKLKLNI